MNKKSEIAHDSTGILMQTKREKNSSEAAVSKDLTSNKHPTHTYTWTVSTATKLSFESIEFNSACKRFCMLEWKKKQMTLWICKVMCELRWTRYFWGHIMCLHVTVSHSACIFPKRLCLKRIYYLLFAALSLSLSLSVFVFVFVDIGMLWEFSDSQAVVHPCTCIRTHTHTNTNYSHQKPFQRRQNVNEGVCEWAPKKRKMIVNNLHEVNWLNGARYVFLVGLLACLREWMRTSTAEWDSDGDKGTDRQQNRHSGGKIVYSRSWASERKQ